VNMRYAQQAAQEAVDRAEEASSNMKARQPKPSTARVTTQLRCDDESPTSEIFGLSEGHSVAEPVRNCLIVETERAPSSSAMESPTL